MNKKQLIIAALATVMTVGASYAASNITGVTGVGGVFDINPDKLNGTVGYRAYDNFILDQGDKANLIFHRNDQNKALDTFINLVGGTNKATINGILNTVDKDGNFTAGHAVFVTKNGMVVGENGVMNVGRLSVITPTTSKYDTLKGEYDADNFTNINQVSQLKKLGTNGSGASDITVNGYIFARDGVHLPGNDISVSGKVVNGLNSNVGLIDSVNAVDASTVADAAYLFNQLVNSDGSIKAANSYINSNGSLLFVNSANEATVTGNLVNLSTGGTVGTNGKTVNNVSVAVTADSNLDVSGKIAANGKLSLYNKQNDLTMSNAALFNKGGELSVTNEGSELVITNSTIKNTTGDVSIVNKGSGNLTITDGSREATAGKITIVNGKDLNSNVGAATIGGTDTAGKNVRIINRGTGLTLSSNIDAGNDVSVRNYGNNGLTQSGTISAGSKGTPAAGRGLLIENHAGVLNINGTLNSEGNVAVKNETDTGKTAGALTTGASSLIQGKNIVAIKNKSNSAMTLNGTVKNTGNGDYYGTDVHQEVKHQTAINNQGTTMTVNGKIENTGNMGIINRGTGKMTVDADIDNTGKLKLANVNGDGFQIKRTSSDNTIETTNGNLSIYNEKGLLDIDGTVKNNSTNDKYLFVFSRNNSTGVDTDANSVLEVKNGHLAVKHNGATADTANGLNLNGTITNSTAHNTNSKGQIAINNYKGKTNVAGTITGNNTIGIIGRTGSKDMAVNATINANNGALLNIKNQTNTGDLTVGGTITQTGRVNILANDGTLRLDGNIINQGTTAFTDADHAGDMTYVYAKGTSDGLETTTNSNITSGKGMVWLRNKGTNGLTHKGSINATNAQAELQNYNGDMTVNGKVYGNKAYITTRSGSGSLVVSDTADLVNDATKTYILHRGKEAGTSVPTKYSTSGVYKYKYSN